MVYAVRRKLNQVGSGASRHSDRVQSALPISRLAFGRSAQLVLATIAGAIVVAVVAARFLSEANSVGVEDQSQPDFAEQSRIGSLTIEAPWTVSRQDTGCSAVLGEAVFTFAGHRYEAIKPVTLADLDRPELLLEGARCLD